MRESSCSCAGRARRSCLARGNGPGGAMVIILMGVAGSGKSTVGRLLADTLGWRYCDADDFHPRANVEKMARGIPLNDEDRQPWLAALQRLVARSVAAGEDMVLACSALKHSYRERLRVDRAAVRLVYLKADPELIRRRLAQRRGHFLGPDLLASQLAALEEPPDALVVDAALPPPAIIAAIRHCLRL